MMSLPGGLAFLNPWVLAGLVFLPLLWFLLRVTPPAPRLIAFPAARFLAGLEPDDHTSSRTPWWILLLRLLVLALIIAALAKPVLNPGTVLPGGNNAVRLVIDNGWAAAQTWDMQIKRAQDIAARAGREGREIDIMTTAPEPGHTKPFYEGPLTQGQAEALLRALAPQPWPADYQAATELLEEKGRTKDIYTFWLSYGLADGKQGFTFAFAQALQDSGALQVVAPNASSLPLMLRPPRGAAREMKVRVDAADVTENGVPVTVQAIGRDGRILDVQQTTLKTEKLPMEVTLDIPEALRNQLGTIRLGGRKGVGAVVLLDDQFKRRAVGIVSPPGDAESAPLIEASYYIQRALEPYAALSTGTIDELLAQELSVIILPDIGAMPPEELNKLEDWVKKGGLLLRFAGPNMTQGETFLTPVPLRKGGRATGGAMTWEKPVKLSSFPDTSPFQDLPVPEDVTIRRQILAEPVEDMEKKTWAQLEDGTPLITANTIDSGLLVMIHTTATAEWSDLALSGLYVQILRRIVNMAGNSGGQSAPPGMLQPVIVLNGFGVPEQPKAYVRPAESAGFDMLVPDSSHPPGLYGRAGYQAALNLGARAAMPQAFKSFPGGVATSLYGGESEKDLMPYVLAAAFCLFLLDWIVMTALQFSWRAVRRRVRPAAVTAAALLLLVFAPPVHAEGSTDYAGNIYLAYVSTGSPSSDTITRQGLEALANVLARRTSVEPGGVVAVDPEKDELAFFPFIYWPIGPESAPLSDKGIGNVQNYLDQGGTILFDTRDEASVPRAGIAPMSGGSNAETLRKTIGSLNIPPLVPMKDDHVVTKSFYLMRSTPGRYDSGIIWVEEQSGNGRDGVSSVIIGSRDWAYAWAAGGRGGNQYYGGTRQEELSLRFGVNVMIYALTGNYKADQVHLPHILERLGQ